MNASKIKKGMGDHSECNISFLSEELEVMDKFRYLGVD